MSIATNWEFSNTTPAPPANQQNIEWANDGGSPTVNISGNDPVMVGDTGSGGKAGNVPAPAAGDAAAGKFLKADGTWQMPPGASSSFLAEEITIAGTSGTLSHAPTALIGIFRNGQRLRGESTSLDYSVSGTTLTLNFTPGGSDVFVAVYFY